VASSGREPDPAFNRKDGIDLNAAHRTRPIGNGATLARHKLERPNHTLGWSPSCACPPGEPVPCRVLDPFAGSGTTVAVAERLGRVGIGVELKPAYLRLAQMRTRQTVLL
jgi:hypothetical protein